jgi:hypothetical protein
LARERARAEEPARRNVKPERLLQLRDLPVTWGPGSGTSAFQTCPCSVARLGIRDATVRPERGDPAFHDMKARYLLAAGRNQLAADEPAIADSVVPA